MAKIQVTLNEEKAALYMSTPKKLGGNRAGSGPELHNEAGLIEIKSLERPASHPC
jgi:hypothetical protein